MKRKRLFTLIEMVIALALLSLVGTVVGVSAKRLIDAHRFESHLLDLFHTLEQAQILSATYNAEVTVDLCREKNTFVARFHTQEPHLKRYFATPKQLPQTAAVTWNAQPISSFHIAIYAGGRIVPRGVLAFFESVRERPRVLYVDTRLGGLASLSYTKPSQIAVMEMKDKPIKS